MIYGLVPAQDIEVYWAEVLPWVVKACRYNGGLYSADDYLSLLLSGKSQLWLVKDPEIIGIIITSIARYPRKKCLMIDICTGKRGGDWIRKVSYIEEWARAQGCKRMFLIARQGMSKMLTDYRKTHVVLEKDL